MAIINNPRTLNLNDIQGMIIRGYSKLFQTAYLMLHVEDGKSANAREWLKHVLPNIHSADISDRATRTLHLAFTASGLKAIGLNDKTVNTFPIPYREGMATENRSRILGDFGESDPQNWRWGGHEDKNPIHMVLIFHTPDTESMDSFLEEQKQVLTKHGGVEVLTEMKAYLREDNKEPFGFHDGISQPRVKGSGRPGPENDIVETGEFLLGYKNEHNQYPSSPYLVDGEGNTSLLADDPTNSARKDLGKNGTFMVFRQIQQHVESFWQHMEDKTKNSDGSVNEEEKVKLASKCIGRWPSGASLLEFPEKDPGGAPDNDDFGYADKDPDGLRCPYGSHLRRNNPRDTFRWYNKKQSLKITRRHRIIRRGRIYELPDNVEPKGKEIGLQFICFNANLELQFEFIQHAWANNNQLRHLNNDIDLVIGASQEGNPNNSNMRFTVQAQPANKFYEGWERFTTIKGGEYFFMPSLTVLNYLTTI